MQKDNLENLFPIAAEYISKRKEFCNKGRVTNSVDEVCMN